MRLNLNITYNVKKRQEQDIEVVPSAAVLTLALCEKLLLHFIKSLQDTRVVKSAASESRGVAPEQHYILSTLCPPCLPELNNVQMTPCC